MMPEQEEQKSIRLTPEQVARLDPFGVRKIPASEELAELLGEGEALFDWAENLINKEKQALWQFFYQEIQVSPLPDDITPEKLHYWEQLGMRLHFLPKINFGLNHNFPGWKVKPGGWFYEQIQKRRISRKATQLSGKWILVDTRDKPTYQEGKQLYANDFLAPIIEKLRNVGMLASYEVPQARAFISWREYHDVLASQIAKILKVKPEQVRLPRAIEFNFLGNAYYPQWGETNTFEWFEDKSSGSRLLGGYSNEGGLADVDSEPPSSRDPGLGFRPLVEFY